MPARVFRLAALACAIPMGCSAYRPPAIAVGEATVVEATEEAVRLDVVVDLENPNDEALELIRFEYLVTVGGERTGPGRWAAEATLAPGGRATLKIPAVLRRRPAGEVAWNVRGSLLYVTPGEVAEILLDTGVRQPRAGFTGSGRLAF